jgi:nitrite reductase (NADH) small subunit
MKDGTAWVRVAYSCDIPLREGRTLQIGGREIAIFNLGDRFLAIENRCPHKGGPLAEGIVSGAAVVCPLHAWKFSLETGKGVNPASELSCVQSFPTRVERGVVLIQMNLESVDADEARLETLSAFCAEQGREAQSGDSVSSAN